MPITTWRKSLSARQLNIPIQAFSPIAILLRRIRLACQGRRPLHPLTMFEPYRQHQSTQRDCHQDHSLAKVALSAFEAGSVIMIILKFITDSSLAVLLPGSYHRLVHRWRGSRPHRQVSRTFHSSLLSSLCSPVCDAKFRLHLCRSCSLTGVGTGALACFGLGDVLC